eukprot:3066913-Rhodomonas_salina.3
MSGTDICLAMNAHLAAISANRAYALFSRTGNAGTGILQALSELERLQGDVDGLEYPHTGRATDDIMGLEGEMWASGGQGFRNLDD